MKRAQILSIVVGATIGVAVGIGGYTFAYAKGAAYLHDDPAVCANCHVMTEQYDGWRHGSHRSVATCNDCHTPPGLVPKYYVKAKNGFWHSFYFTTELFHEPIQITASNREVTEQACRKCHAAIVQAIDPVAGHDDQTSCLRCHRDVGHKH
jgi:cytochrome c nitrite reductase small subunit